MRPRWDVLRAVTQGGSYGKSVRFMTTAHGTTRPAPHGKALLSGGEGQKHQQRHAGPRHGGRWVEVMVRVALASQASMPRYTRVRVRAQAHSAECYSRGVGGSGPVLKEGGSVGPGSSPGGRDLG